MTLECQNIKSKDKAGELRLKMLERMQRRFAKEKNMEHYFSNY